LLVVFSRYVPGYLKELQDGHKEELNLFKGQLNEVREKLVRIRLHPRKTIFHAKMGNFSNAERKLLNRLENILLRGRMNSNFRMMRLRIWLGVCLVLGRILRLRL
jgi:hypothetical protein